jgi:hypothetical protein
MKASTSQMRVKARSSGPSKFAPWQLPADLTTPAPVPEKSFHGIVVSMDHADHRLCVKNWLKLRKAFNLGESCTFAEVGNELATADMVRAGEMVEVNYRNSHGVLIADRVKQIPMQMTGMVASLDDANRTLTLQRTPINKLFVLPDDCLIALRDGKIGAWDDIKSGNFVTVTYEMPDNIATVRQIAQTSLEFTGELTAIDLEDRTVKVKCLFTSTKFHLGGDCAFVMKGEPNGRVMDLRLGDLLACSYEVVNGINVVNRIAVLEADWSRLAIPAPAPGF